MRPGKLVSSGMLVNLDNFQFSLMLSLSPFRAYSKFSRTTRYSSTVHHNSSLTNISCLHTVLDLTDGSNLYLASTLLHALLAEVWSWVELRWGALLAEVWSWVELRSGAGVVTTHWLSSQSHSSIVQVLTCFKTVIDAIMQIRSPSRKAKNE